MTLSFKMLNLSVKNKFIALKRCNALTLQALTAHLWLFITLTSTSTFGFSFVPQSQEFGFRFTRFHHLILGSADTFTLHSTPHMIWAVKMSLHIYMLYIPPSFLEMCYTYGIPPHLPPPPLYLSLDPLSCLGEGGGGGGGGGA